MQLDPEELVLLEEYKDNIQETEKIIWTDKMQSKNFNITKDVSVPPELLFWVFLILSSFLMNGFYLFVLKALLIMGLIVGIIYYSDHIKKLNRQNKLKYTEYILTKEQLIFIQWHNQKVQINALPISNIKQVLISRIPRTIKSLYIVTKRPVDFSTYNFWNDSKTPNLTLLNINNANELHSKLRSMIKK